MTDSPDPARKLAHDLNGAITTIAANANTLATAIQELRAALGEATAGLAEPDRQALFARHDVETWTREAPEIVADIEAAVERIRQLAEQVRALRG